MPHIPITAGWFLALLSMLVVTLVTGTVCAARWAPGSRRARGWTAWACGGLSLILAGVTGLAFVNAHYGYYQWLDDLTNERSWPDGAGKGLHPDGGVLSAAMPGTTSKVTAADAMIYLPPQYWTQPSRAFPVLYLIHGTPGGPDDLFRAGRASDAALAAARSGFPLIVVAPSVGSDWTSDTECVDGAQGQWDRYVSVDVVAAVERNLRTIRTREGRAIAGLSMGGYCALNLGLRHRDRFATVVDLSGLTAPTFDSGLRALFGDVADLTAVVDANTPRSYVARLPRVPLERVWLDCGQDDDTGPLADITAIAPRLQSRGFDVALSTRSGGHEWAVWRAALADSIPWAAAAMTATTSLRSPQ